MAAHVSPVDTTGLHAQLATATAQIGTLQQQLTRALIEAQQLRSQLDWFKRQLFGAKSERQLPDPAVQPDMLLALGVNAPSPATPVELTAQLLRFNQRACELLL